MTREDIITNLRYWCNNIDKPCEECKIHDICVVRDHVQHLILWTIKSYKNIIN